MEDKKEQVQITETQTVLYSGPLPASQEFAKYEQVLPGTAFLVNTILILNYQDMVDLFLLLLFFVIILYVSFQSN